MKQGCILVVAALMGLAGREVTGQELPGWGTPVWQDEFDGERLDLTKWTFDIGGGGWGNNELQYYTDRIENSYLANGCLVIEAREEKYRNRRYTSARLKTQGLASWAYGRMEARIQMPLGEGAWPAFWMLGANFTDVGWPDCGEIDVMEWVSELGDTIRGSAHGPEYYGANSYHGDWPGPLTGGFHVYAVEWEPQEIRWYVDNEEYSVAKPRLGVDPANEVPGTWVFDHPFFIIVNLALGGWGGPVAESTAFPLRMYVDYVRVYQMAVPPPPGLAPLYATIDMDIKTSGPKNWEAVATIQVHDENGIPVPEVEVKVDWSGLIHVGVTEGFTDADGIVRLNSGKVRVNGTIQCCIQSLTKSGWFYADNDCNNISR